MILESTYESMAKAIKNTAERAEALGHRLTEARRTVNGKTRRECQSCLARLDIFKDGDVVRATGFALWDGCTG